MTWYAFWDAADAWVETDGVQHGKAVVFGLGLMMLGIWWLVDRFTNGGGDGSAT